MKILLNIAGWFLYFVPWQKGLLFYFFYLCQFTLNSQSCQGSLYQGASNTRSSLNDSKVTALDFWLTTSEIHAQHISGQEMLFLSAALKMEERWATFLKPALRSRLDLPEGIVRIKWGSAENYKELLSYLLNMAGWASSIWRNRV